MPSPGTGSSPPGRGWPSPRCGNSAATIPPSPGTGRSSTCCPARCSPPCSRSSRWRRPPARSGRSSWPAPKKSSTCSRCTRCTPNWPARAWTCASSAAGFPAQALAHAVSTVGPAAVFVWSQVPATAQPGLLEGLPAGPRIVVGGPGWQDRRPGPAAHLAGSLEEAAAELAGPRFAPPDEPPTTHTPRGGADAGIRRTDRAGRHGWRPRAPRAGRGGGRGGARAWCPGRPGRGRQDAAAAAGRARRGGRHRGGARRRR